MQIKITARHHLTDTGTVTIKNIENDKSEWAYGKLGALPGGNVEPQKYTPYKDTFIIVVKIIDYINEHGRYYVKWNKPDSKSNTACFH